MTGRSREPGSSEELSGLKGTTGPIHESHLGLHYPNRSD